MVLSILRRARIRSGKRKVFIIFKVFVDMCIFLYFFNAPKLHINCNTRARKLKKNLNDNLDVDKPEDDNYS